VHRLQGEDFRIGRYFYRVSTQAGIVLAAVALLTRLVPQAVVERLGWNYASYQWDTFIGTLLLLGGIMWAAIVFRSSHRQPEDEERAYELCAFLLAYLPILPE